MFAGGDYHFDVFGEELGKPEGDVGLAGGLVVGESIDCFDDDNHFLVDLLRAVDNLLFLDLGGGQIQPVGKEFPDVFLEEIYTLFQFEGLFQFYDDLVEGVEVVGVVAAVAGEVHYCEDLLFSGGVGLPDSFLPLREDGLHAAAGFRAEHEGLVGVLLEPAVDFVDVLFLAGVGLLGLVVFEDCLGGAG